MDIDDMIFGDYDPVRATDEIFLNGPCGSFFYSIYSVTRKMMLFPSGVSALMLPPSA